MINQDLKEVIYNLLNKDYGGIKKRCQQITSQMGWGELENYARKQAYKVVVCCAHIRMKIQQWRGLEVSGKQSSIGEEDKFHPPELVKIYQVVVSDPGGTSGGRQALLKIKQIHYRKTINNQ